ncbi:MAG TPA: hypothetical protein VFS47_09825 [Steroidobacteraceae bacterium]|nr:hypothetical protein [Steroidobacteraceae bacterium]
MKSRFEWTCALMTAGVLVAPTSQAQEVGTRAVSSTSFDLGLTSRNIDTADSTSNGTVDFFGVLTAPIGNVLGVSLDVGYAKSRVRTSDVLGSGETDTTSPKGARSSCTFKGTNADATLFARRPTLGKLSVSYGIADRSSDCGESSVFTFTGDDSLNSNHYRFAGEAYLGNFTIGASRTSTDLEDGPKLETNEVSASWYAMDNLRVTAYGNDLYDDNTYGLQIEHQPEFMGNDLGIWLGFSQTDGTPRTRIISVGVQYHFGRNATLKVRDRELR